MIIINSQLPKDYIFRTALLKDNEVLIKNDVSDIVISDVLQAIVDYEQAVIESNVRLQLDSFSTKQLEVVFSFVFKNILDIRNASLILNLLNLIRPYNTFDDEFFKSENIMFNDIEQFLDLKMTFSDEIEKLSRQLVQTFISLCKSTIKMEYSELDDYEDLPIFYKVLFSTIDLYSIFEIMSTLPSDISFSLKKYKHANVYVDAIVSKYTCASILMDILLKKKK